MGNHTTMTDRAMHDHHADEHDTHEHETDSHHSEQDAAPASPRQLLHWATGDRQAEAKALADASDEEVTEEDAELAVRRSPGDLGSDDSPVDTDVASPEDAEAAHEDRAPRR